MVHEFVDAGDVIVALGVDSGVCKATGKGMKVPTASVWSLKDGTIVQFRQ